MGTAIYDLLTTTTFWLYYVTSFSFAFWFNDRKLKFSAVGCTMKVAFLLCLPSFIICKILKVWLLKLINSMINNNGATR
ncbi:hypothetical protein DZF79_03055 [Vibrio parahaemolyticus]|nr:hypothetical protein [Vibrio parahaemolyticus]